MKAFAVYGKDLTTAIAEFDTVNEAIEYARKGLRESTRRTVKSRKYREVYYSVCKINDKVEVKRHVAIHA